MELAGLLAGCLCVRVRARCLCMRVSVCICVHVCDLVPLPSQTEWLRGHRPTLS